MRTTHAKPDSAVRRSGHGLKIPANRSIGGARHCAEAIIFVYAMKAYGGMEVQLHQLLTSALYVGVCSTSFNDPGKVISGVQYVEGRIDSRADLYSWENRKGSFPCRDKNHDSPANRDM